jgi:predicted nucleic acid-binding protein
MAKDGRTPALIDTSVLLNFLAIDHADLLAAHPDHRFVVTDHVRGEITDRRPERLERFEAALAAGLFDQTSVDAPEELRVFVELQRTGQLGEGESAAAAAAKVRGHVLATDDRRAKKIIGRLFPELRVLDTADLIRGLIAAGTLTVAQADAIKAEWETRHRFRLPFASFASEGSRD